MTLQEFQAQWSARNPLVLAMRRRHYKQANVTFAIGCSRPTLQRWVEGSIDPFGKRGDRRFVKNIADFCGLTVDEARTAWRVWQEEKINWRAEWNDRVAANLPGAVIEEKKSKKPRPSAPHLNPLVRAMRANGDSVRGLADGLNRKGSTEPVAPTDYNFTTAAMINSWRKGKAVPWEHSEEIFDKLFQWYEHLWFYKDITQRNWRAWLEGRLTEPTAKASLQAGEEEAATV